MDVPLVEAVDGDVAKEGVARTLSAAAAAAGTLFNQWTLAKS